MEDMQRLRAYITAKDGAEYDEMAETTVCLNVTHSNLKMIIAEIRFDKHSTIAEVKEKIYHHCGTSSNNMELLLLSGSSTVALLNDDARKLGFYPVQHGMTLHVKDNDPFSLSRGGGLEDVSLVKKYVMSDNDYSKREKTVRAYKKEQLAKDPTWVPKHLRSKKKGDVPPPEVDPDQLSKVTLGSRCEVQPGSRRGKVAFVGEIAELGNGGVWVGVHFDEPVGKSNGSLKGHSYFECPENFGAFVRVHNVSVGDYPEVDPFADLSDDEDEI